MATPSESSQTSTAATRGEPQKPKEIEFLPINFTMGGDSILKGYEGIPSFIMRTRALEDATDRFWRGLGEAYTQLRLETATPAEFSRRWQFAVDEWDFSSLQHLVHDYNEYFPIEANLPIDPHTGGLTYRGEPWVKAAAPTREEVLRRFPLDGSGPRQR